MPREIVHWGILDEATNTLSVNECPKVCEVLKEHRAAAFLGATMLDAPYYCEFGNNFEFEKVGHYLHGVSREDTFDSVRLLASSITKHSNDDEQKLLWAFLLGMTTHISVDSTFHPLVVYYTGNYFDPNEEQRKRSITKHRLFETYMDSWFMPKIKLWNNGSLSVVVSKMESNLKLICEILAVSLKPTDCELTEKEMYGLWQKSFKHHARLQYYFLSNTVGSLVRLGKELAFDKVAPIDALFSFRRRNVEAVFDSTFKYQNSVSGEKAEHSVTELYQLSTSKCVEVLKVFESMLDTTASAELALDKLKGLSLDYGVYGAAPEDSVYYCSAGLTLPGLQ